MVLNTQMRWTELNQGDQPALQIRILTSCTGAKRYSPNNQLTQADFHYLHTPEEFSGLENRLLQYRTHAAELYTGLQHTRLMDGIRHISTHANEHDIDLWILSAGYGLIAGNQKIVPYECTFQNMKASEICNWTHHLRIPQIARELLARPANLFIILLGSTYLRVLDLDHNVTFAAPTLFLTSRINQKHVKGKGQFRVIALSNPEAKRFSCGMVGLKGEIAKRVLYYLHGKGQEGVPHLFNSSVDVLDILDEMEYGIGQAIG
jgi:hypothetical protein